MPRDSAFWKRRDTRPKGRSPYLKDVCRFCGEQAGGLHNPVRCAKQYQDRLDAEARARKEGCPR